MQATKDQHCAVAAREIEQGCDALRHAIERTVIEAKAHVAQEAQDRLNHERGVHSRIQEELQLENEAATRKVRDLEAALARSYEQTNRLASKLAQTRTSGTQSPRRTPLL